MISENKNILKVINEDLSIRKGKYGEYIFYKTKTMKKPRFININKLKNIDNILTCSPEQLIKEVNNLL